MEADDTRGGSEMEHSPQGEGICTTAIVFHKKGPSTRFHSNIV